MKITPVSSPAAIPLQGTPEHVRSARAIAAFNKASESSQTAHAQPPTQVVANQNAIAVEELGAIQTQSEIDTETVNESVETQTTEETPVVESKVDPALSRQFAQLARQEKAVRAAQQQLKAEKAALAAERASLTQPPPQQQDLSNYVSRDRIKQDALAVLAEQGVSYDELTQQLLNQHPTDPRVQATIGRLEAKIAQLEKANETSQKSQTESQQQQYDAAVKQIRNDAKRLVFTDPTFETIKATNSVNDVVELITQTYEKDGVLLSVEEAAQQVEDYLVDEATKIAQIKKIQTRLQANSNSNAALQAKTQTPKPAQQQPMKTLTNATSSSRQLTAKERAILAFKGELKS